MKILNHLIPKISNEDTALLPAAEFDGKICVVDNESDIEAACEDLSRYPMIGFDTETRPSFRPGVSYKVSLLQLSTPEVCYLFRLNRISLAKPLLQLLESKKVQKVGVAVSGDIHCLNQLRHFREGGFIDLQSMIEDWGVEEKSLRKMSAIVLGERVSKAQRLSNWEAATLTERQMVYAATDAWVCIRIYNQLQKIQKVK